MIDSRRPDYDNTPISAGRPVFEPRPARLLADPPISIITPCYNVGPWLAYTSRSVWQQSFQQFEWLLVDDGSTDAESTAALHRLAEQDERVRVIRQENAGPGAARNRGAREAKGQFLFWLDADDLIEPTYLEKALWCLTSHPDFDFCNAWPVGFGAEQYLWPRGCLDGVRNLDENQLDKTALVRRDVHLKMGGFDESIRIGHEDWDYWLSMAGHGHWGWTIPEFLIWYRRHEHSRITLTEGDAARKSAFKDFLRTKHAGIYAKPDQCFRRLDLDNLGPADVCFDVPWSNPLANVRGRRRLLVVVPWLVMGGADKFNLDVVRQLAARDWEITIVTTLPSDHVWLPEFTRLTSDVFCVDRFLRMADYPRFMAYLLASRGITHALVTNSQVGYELLPFLRSASAAAFADYCHSAPPDWRNGGYPTMSARWTECLDLHVVLSEHLRKFMIERGAAPERIEICHSGIDPAEWSADKFDRPAARRELLEDGDPPDVPLVVWTGRFCDDKRPQFLIEILRTLRDEGAGFVALLAGDGEHKAEVASLIAKYELQSWVRLLGPLPNEKIKRLLAAADVFLLPSAVEGISLSMIEAMCMGVTPVSADVGGQAELVTADVGYLIPHGPAKTELRAYVDAVRRLIDDREHRLTLSAAARHRIITQFSLDELGRRMQEVLIQAGENHAKNPCPVLPAKTAAQCAALSIDRLRLELLADQLWLKLQARTPDSENPEEAPLDVVRAQLACIESARSWRMIQGFKRLWPCRWLSRLRYGAAVQGPDAQTEPRERLHWIRQSRPYRVLRAVKHTAICQVYTRRKYGQNAADIWV